MPQLKKIFALILSLLLTVLANASERPAAGATHVVAKRIAHAGGGLGKLTYTNSYQALESNLAKGFEYFELDFVFTRDGHLVCLHDWQSNFRRAFGFSVDRSLSLEEFEQAAMENSKFTNCTLEGLAVWMRKNPSAVIVTDVKDDNVRALRLISEVLPDSGRRVIPQIYIPENFPVVKSMGYERLIWTLYRIRISDQQVLSHIEDWPGPFSIAMPKRQARSPLPAQLSARGIPSYVHTINSAGDLKRFQSELGITEIYTDFLAP